MPLFGKKPVTNVPALSAEELKTRLLGLNRQSAPFSIVDGQSEGVDLIAEWKIVDASWYEIFAKAKLQKVFRIFMKLDAGKKELRAQDHEYSISWSAGVPSLKMVVSSFQGQMTSVEFGTAYAFTETLAPGQVYNYKFNTNELKKPIQNVAESCGWNYKSHSKLPGNPYSCLRISGKNSQATIAIIINIPLANITVSGSPILSAATPANKEPIGIDPKNTSV
jgi:hypothetical protein